MFKIAATLNFILAVGHFACLPWLDVAFSIYGIDAMMNEMSARNVALPYLITVIIALCFALCGIYALSAAGTIRRLPLLRLGIFTVAIIFLSRAGLGTYWMTANGRAPFTDLSSVLVAAVIGLLYLCGGVFRFTPQTKRLLPF